MIISSSCALVHAAARETEPGQRGGEVSGDQRGRPAEQQQAVDDQEHNGREADPPVLQQGDLHIIKKYISQSIV